MTEDPEFLSVDEIVEISDDQIQCYGGDVGIRDRGLLESAIAMPQQSFGGQYLHKDIFEMAAAYSFTSRKARRLSMGTSAPDLPQRICFSA